MEDQLPHAVVGSDMEMGVSSTNGGMSTTMAVRDADEKRLNELGYKQEYRRLMTPFQQWAYTFSYTAPLGFITGYYGFMYSYGGPVTIIWGYIATTFGTLCMAFGMSEVNSNNKHAKFAPVCNLLLICKCPWYVRSLLLFSVSSCLNWEQKNFGEWIPAAGWDSASTSAIASSHELPHIVVLLAFWKIHRFCGGNHDCIIAQWI